MAFYEFIIKSLLNQSGSQKAIIVIALGFLALALAYSARAVLGFRYCRIGRYRRAVFNCAFGGGCSGFL